MDVITTVFGETRRTRILIAASMSAGIILLLVNFLFINALPEKVAWRNSVFSVLNLVSAAIVIGPSLFLRYREFSYSKDIERRFPDFLRDVTEGIRAGMTLPIAIKSTERNKYGALTPHVKKIIAQIDWGVPFEQVLENFAKHGTKTMKRTVTTIIETHRSGGNIADVLSAVEKSVVQIDKIKTERAAHIYSQMITGYVIFFIFLGVMIGLQKFLLPSLTFMGESGTAGTENLTKVYSVFFQWLIVIQGAFSGLAIGKMAEGSVMAGLKHSFVMVAIGFSAYTIAVPV